MTSGNSNKYKAEVIRLTQMLQSTFKQVHYYKKLVSESESQKQQLVAQNDKYREENKYLEEQCEYYKQAGQLEPERQLRKLKNQYDATVTVNKVKNYMEKVHQVIREIAVQCKNRGKSEDTNMLALQRAFAKASMGVIKYQQEFIKQAADKQMVRAEADKLRKQNTYLYEMTSKLQDNFVQSDKITKKLHNESKKLKQQNAHLLSTNAQLLSQLQQRRKAPSKKSIQLSSQSPTSDHHQYQSVDKAYYSTSNSQGKIKGNQNKMEDIVRDLEKKVEGLMMENKKLKEKERNKESVEENEEDQVNRLREQLEQYKQCLQSLNQKLEHAQATNEQLQAELESARTTQPQNSNLQHLHEKISQLQSAIKQKDLEIENLRQQIEHSQVEKDKIITVYQNQSHESKDKIIRHQDALMELEKLAKSLKNKNEELGKLNKNVTRQLAQKQAQIEQLNTIISQKEQLIQKIHCQRQKQRLVNELNMKNFEQSDQNLHKIETLQSQIAYLQNQNQQLEQNLSQKHRHLTQQNIRLQKEKLSLESKYEDTASYVQVLEMGLRDKDVVVGKLEGQLVEINRRLNQLAQTWSVDDSYQIIQALSERYRKQNQAIVDLTLHREKVINQNKNNQLSFIQQKSELRKQKQQLLKHNYHTIQQLSKIFNLKNILSPNSQPLDLHLNFHEDLDTSLTITDTEIFQKWQKIVEQLEQYKQMMDRQRMKMEEIEAAWWRKEAHLVQEVEQEKRKVGEYQQIVADMAGKIQGYERERDVRDCDPEDESVVEEYRNKKEQEELEFQQLQSFKNDPYQESESQLLQSQQSQQQQPQQQSQQQSIRISQLQQPSSLLISQSNNQSNQPEPNPKQSNLQSNLQSQSKQHQQQIQQLQQQLTKLNAKLVEAEQCYQVRLQEVGREVDGRGRRIQQLEELLKEREKEKEMEKERSLGVDELRDRIGGLEEEIGELKRLCLFKESYIIELESQLETLRANKQNQQQSEQVQSSHISQQPVEQSQYQEYEQQEQQPQEQQQQHNQTLQLQQSQLQSQQSQQPQQSQSQQQQQQQQPSIILHYTTLLQQQQTLNNTLNQQIQQLNKQIKTQHLSIKNVKDMLRLVREDEVAGVRRMVEEELVGYWGWVQECVGGMLYQYEEQRVGRLVDETVQTNNPVLEQSQAQTHTHTYTQTSSQATTQLQQSQNQTQPQTQPQQSTQTQTQTQPQQNPPPKPAPPSTQTQTQTQTPPQTPTNQQTQTTQTSHSLNQLQTKLAQAEQLNAKLGVEVEQCRVKEREFVYQCLKYEQEIQCYRGQYVGLGDKVGVLEMEIKAIRDQRDAIKQQLNKAEAKQCAIQQQHEQTQKGLRAQLQQSENRCTQLLNQTNNLILNIQHLQSQPNPQPNPQPQLIPMLQTLPSSLTAILQNFHQNYNNKTTAQQQKLNQLHHQLSVVRVGFQRQLMKETGKLHKQIRLLLEEIKEQQELIQRLQEESVEGLSMAAKKDAHARILQAKLNQAEVQIANMRQAVQQANTDISTYKQKYNESIQKLQKSLNHISQLQQKIQSLKTKQDRLNTDLHNKSKQLQLCQSSIQKLQASNTLLEKQITMHKEDLLSLEKEHQQAMEEKNNQIGELAALLDRYDEEREEREERVEVEVQTLEEVVGVDEKEEEIKLMKEELQEGNLIAIRNIQQREKRLEEIKEQIEKRQQGLIKKEEQITKRTSQAQQLQRKCQERQEKLKEQQFFVALSAEPSNLKPDRIQKHAESIRPVTNTKTVEYGAKRQSIPERQIPQRQSIDLPLQFRPQKLEKKQEQQDEKIKGTLSYRSNKQESLQKQLKLTQEYREILQAQNKNLKKQIIRKDKACSKLKQAQKQITHYEKLIQKLKSELELKQKLVLKYDKELKLKIEENMKYRRNIENIEEELDLEKKRNKNFEDLYQKYQMQKKNIIGTQ